jgi:hypothetical protein
MNFGCKNDQHLPNINVFNYTEINSEITPDLCEVVDANVINSNIENFSYSNNCYEFIDEKFFFEKIVFSSASISINNSSSSTFNSSGIKQSNTSEIHYEFIKNFNNQTQSIKSNEVFSVSKFTKEELRNDELRFVCRKIFRAFIRSSIENVNGHLRNLNFEYDFKTCSEEFKEEYSFKKVKEYSSQTMREIFKKTEIPKDNDEVISEIDLKAKNNQNDKRFMILVNLLERTLEKAFLEFLDDEIEFSRYVKIRKNLGEKERKIYLNFIKLAKTEFRKNITRP